MRPKNCKVSIRCNEIKTKWFDFLVGKAVNLPLAESIVEGGSGGPALLTVKHQCDDDILKTHEYASFLLVYPQTSKHRKCLKYGLVQLSYKLNN